MKTWIATKPDDDFSLHNIPFGIAQAKKAKLLLPHGSAIL
jgi:hypothetical protein